MYLQKEESECVNGEGDQDQSNSKTTSAKIKVATQIQPEKRKDLWGRRIGIGKSKMYYWQRASDSTIL